MKITPRNWAKFQHYKSRRPPWIKLHRALLDDYEFTCLSLASRALAPCIWLLASESEDGSIDLHPQKLAFRLRVDEKTAMECVSDLFQKKFIDADEDASDMLAKRQHCAITETETEVEIEADVEVKVETEVKIRKATSNAPAPTSETWNAYNSAYRKRYGVDATRNGKVNKTLLLLLARIGSDEAPLVAAFFVAHNSGYYIQRGHSVDCLLSDAEKLRTEWATNRTTTQTQARMTDETQTRLNVWGPIIEEARRKKESENG